MGGKPQISIGRASGVCPTAGGEGAGGLYNPTGAQAPAAPPQVGYEAVFQENWKSSSSAAVSRSLLAMVWGRNQTQAPG